MPTISRMKNRICTLSRNTSETQIQLEIDLDGVGRSEVHTGVGFLDHMLALFSKHSLIDVKLTANGDLHIDAHHTVEDVGICLGRAINQALGDKAGIRRYGFFMLPMDETRATVAVDFGGRPVFVWNVNLPNEMLGNFSSPLAEEFWRAFSSHSLSNLHVECAYGTNGHHLIEAIFKATARAVRMAVEYDPRDPSIPSTKGTLSW